MEQHSYQMPNPYGIAGTAFTHHTTILVPFLSFLLNTVYLLEDLKGKLENV